MYNLEMSDDQIRILTAALDLYVRVGIGQIEEVGHLLSDGDTTCDQNDCITKCCRDIKKILGHPHNGSHGISSENVRTNFKVAYDLECVIRQTTASARNETQSVWNHAPMHLAPDVPLARCYQTKQETE